MNRRSFLAAAGSTTLLALAASYPVAIERTRVEINRYRIPVDGLPASFHGFTLAHLTDLHLGPLVSASFVAGVVERINRLRADMIVCTGDYVRARDTREEIDRVWPLLAGLQAAQGTCSVLGNHDHWADFARSRYWLERTGQDIRHKCRIIRRGPDRLFVAGAGDLWEDRLGIDQAFAGTDEGACRVLLAHNPDTVDTPFTTPVSLVVSGHTHGGQVVVPGVGPPVLPVRNKAYASGLIETPKTRLFISRGIGWSILPVRFNCAPEIALLELVRADLLPSAGVQGSVPAASGEGNSFAAAASPCRAPAGISHASGHAGAADSRASSSREDARESAARSNRNRSRFDWGASPSRTDS